jgi:hypothetical protein
MSITRVVAPFFMIVELKAARKSYLADGQPIAADVFASDGTEVPMEFPFVNPGTNVTMTVTNIDAAPHFFHADLWGIPSDDCGSCL